LCAVLLRFLPQNSPASADLVILGFLVILLIAAQARRDRQIFNEVVLGVFIALLLVTT